jgi:amino acid adenylation domain-containing protein
VASDLNDSTDFRAAFKRMKGFKELSFSKINVAVTTDEWLLHGCFVNQASRDPAATAVICDEREISYGELLKKAQRLARELIRLGVEPGALVGVCAERSVELIVGIYGILLAGGAYVPLDPGYPEDRINFMIEDAQVFALVTQHKLASRFETNKAPLVLLDGLRISQEEAEFELPELDASQLGYVIYTSGSTGRPKGVMITHRSAMNTIHDINRRFHVGPEDRVLALSSPCFDLSVYDTFGLLGAGGAIVIPTAEGRREPAFWAEQVKQHQITLWNSVPAFMEMLTAHASGMNQVHLNSLRVVMLSGDWIAVSLPDRIRQLSPDAEIISLGGATEASIWSNIYTIGQVDPAWKSIPYGKALDQQSMTVLDEQLRLCEPGVVGEIYYGGAGIAVGYLHREQLTAERFIPAPPPFEPTDRLYRTGDLGRLLPDGNVEFLGRIDHQVKISGYRIELGEIESALVRQPNVAEAVVIARQATIGVTYLAAYYTTVDHQPLETSVLLAGLRTSLPEYMLPTRVKWLATLPLSANGKVDRAVLPDLGRATATPVPTARFVTATQIELASIWTKLLKSSPPSPECRFFQLGGDSLQAVQLSLEIRRQWQVDLGIVKLLSPELSLADLAAAIDASCETTRGHAPVANPTIRAVAHALPAPMSSAQEQLWTLDQFGNSGAAYNIPLAVRLRGQLDVPALKLSLNKILSRHESLRTVFKSISVGQVIQQVLPLKEWPFRIADISGTAAAQRQATSAEFLQQELRKHFDLARGPLVRALLVKLDDGEYQLLLTIHHIVADGWSLAVLIDEINSLYLAATNKSQAILPVLPVQYADYSRWQRHWLASPEATSSGDYWRQKLARDLPELKLPVDYPAAHPSDSASALYEFAVPEKLCFELKELCRRQEITLYVALLSSWSVLLSKLTGQNEIAVGTPVACRSQPEVQHLIGCLINTLVMRTGLPEHLSLQQLLANVRTTAHEAFAHGDYPFIELARQLAAAGKIDHKLYNVMFAWQNTPAAAFALPGISAELLVVDPGNAKFDLLLAMQEQGSGLTGSIEYRTALFDRETIGGWIKLLLALLDDIATCDLATAVASLPALGKPLPMRPAVKLNSFQDSVLRNEVSPRRDEYSQPHDEIERRMQAIWEKSFELSAIGIRDNFFDLGGDSLLATALLARMEREFQRTFSNAVLLERPTIEQLAEWLRSDQQRREFSSLVLLQPGTGQQNLFCMPGIHGSLWEFRKLAGLLDPTLTVYGLEPRGLDGTQQPDQTIAEMANHYTAELQRAQPEGPFYLIGYSLGGPVAYEVAQRLVASGREVAKLVMIDAPIGGHSRPMRMLQSTLYSTVDFGRSLLRTMAPLFGRQVTDAAMSEHPGQEAFPPGRELVFQTHRRALDAYTPQPYAGRITILRASIPLPWPKRWFADTTLQWLRLATGEVHAIPGGHFVLFNEQYIGPLAAKIMECLQAK